MRRLLLALGLTLYTSVALGAGAFVPSKEEGFTPQSGIMDVTGLVEATLGFDVQTDLESQPTCDDNARGRIWYTSNNGTGDDDFEICIEEDGSTFAWTDGIAAGGGGGGDFSGPASSTADALVIFSGTGGKTGKNSNITVNATDDMTIPGALLIDSDADVVTLTVQADASQTASLVELENSAGTALVTFDASGNMTFNSTQTLDGVDLSVHAAGADSHHNESHQSDHAENQGQELQLEDLGTGSAVANQFYQADGTGGIDANTDITFPGASNLSVQALSATGAISSSTQYVRVDTSGGVVTGTLPSASAVANGRVIQIKCEDCSSFDFTLALDGADTIDGSAGTLTFTGTEGIALVSDGVSNWDNASQLDTHASTHELAGSDLLSVAGLLGVLGTSQIADTLDFSTDLTAGTLPTDGQHLCRSGTTFTGCAAGLTGSLTATRVPVASGAGALTDDDSFIYSTANKRLGLGGTLAAGSLITTLHINDGTVVDLSLFPVTFNFIISATESSLDNSILIAQASAAATANPKIVFSRGRGTIDAMTVVSDNDILGLIIGEGTDGDGDSVNHGRIMFRVDGTPTVSTVPIELVLQTGVSVVDDTMILSPTHNVDIPNGNLTLSGGGTVDGTDISVHVADADAHHAQGIAGSSLVATQVLVATGANAATSDGGFIYQTASDELSLGGATDPLATLHVNDGSSLEADGVVTAPQILNHIEGRASMELLSINSTANLSSILHLGHGRGTAAAITGSSSGDTLGILAGLGYSASGGPVTTGFISFIVDEAPAGIFVPSRIEFNTQNNPGDNTIAVVIDSDQHTGFGSPTIINPLATIHVNDNNIPDADFALGLTSHDIIISNSGASPGIRFDGGNGIPRIDMSSSGTSLTAPSAVGSSAAVGRWFVHGHDGTDFENTGAIQWETDGAVSTDVVPMSLRIFTSATNAAGLTARFIVDSDGDVHVVTNDLVIDAGNITLSGSATVDGTDISAHVANASAHHTAGVTGSLTATRVPVASGASALVDNANFIYSTGNSRLGLGGSLAAASLDASLHMNDGNSPASSLLINSDVDIYITDQTDSPTIVIVGAGQFPRFHAGRASGTLAAPTATGNAQLTYLQSMSGFDGTDFEETIVIDTFMEAAAATNDVPQIYRIRMSEDDDANLVQVLRIVSNGSAVFGVDTTPDGKLSVDGGIDQIQFIVAGHSTQTSDIVVIETSAGTDLFTITNAGNVAVPTGELILGGGEGIARSDNVDQVTIDVGDIAANTCVDTSQTVTGSAVGDICTVGAPASPAAGISFTCHISAVNTLQLRGCNVTTSLVNPDSAAYSFMTFRP